MTFRRLDKENTVATVSLKSIGKIGTLNSSYVNTEPFKRSPNRKENEGTKTISELLEEEFWNFDQIFRALFLTALQRLSCGTPNGRKGVSSYAALTLVSFYSPSPYRNPASFLLLNFDICTNLSFCLLLDYISSRLTAVLGREKVFQYRFVVSSFWNLLIFLFILTLHIVVLSR